jgi:hypothetical protein
LQETQVEPRMPGPAQDGQRREEQNPETPAEQRQSGPAIAAPVPAPGPSRPQQCRACAVCGRTARNGAKLRRCAGCGRATGTRYCSQECCRTDWVVRGHRAVCEAARRGGSSSSGGQPEGVGA